MIGNLLAPLGAKIGLGLSLALAIAFGVQALRLATAHDTIEKRDLAIRALNADIERVQAAADEMVRQGAARTAAATQALAEHQRKSAATQQQIVRIRNVKPAAGCKTPAEVLEASL